MMETNCGISGKNEFFSNWKNRYYRNQKKKRDAQLKRVSEWRHNTFNDNSTSRNQIIRSSLEYKLWREAVFKRDNWACIWCGNKGKLNADHIKPFAYYPELRFAIDNGRTLCVKCHKSTDTYANKAHKYRQ